MNKREIKKRLFRRLASMIEVKHRTGWPWREQVLSGVHENLEIPADDPTSDRVDQVVQELIAEFHRRGGVDSDTVVDRLESFPRTPEEWGLADRPGVNSAAQGMSSAFKRAIVGMITNVENGLALSDALRICRLAVRPAQSMRHEYGATDHRVNQVIEETLKEVVREQGWPVDLDQFFS